jgi:hypothetical protein
VSRTTPSVANVSIAKPFDVDTLKAVIRDFLK